MKRYEQHTMDHQHYAEAYSDAARWLQTNRERLSVCADTTGDRQKIQTQLEKLQVRKITTVSCTHIHTKSMFIANSVLFFLICFKSMIINCPWHLATNMVPCIDVL